MAATRRRRKAKEKVGKEAWQIVGPDGKVIKETGHGAGPMLINAQTLVQKETCPDELEVRLKPLFGEPDTFYRVVLDEDGAVNTYPV